jgi:hypothetical protein
MMDWFQPPLPLKESWPEPFEPVEWEVFLRAREIALKAQQWSWITWWPGPDY